MEILTLNASGQTVGAPYMTENGPHPFTVTIQKSRPSILSPMNCQFITSRCYRYLAVSHYACLLSETWQIVSRAYI